MVKFLANVKRNTFHIELLRLLFGQLLKKIGHLVTLSPITLLYAR